LNISLVKRIMVYVCVCVCVCFIYIFLHGKNNFAEESKILLHTDLKIILLEKILIF